MAKAELSEETMNQLNEWFNIAKETKRFLQFENLDEFVKFYIRFGLFDIEHYILNLIKNDPKLYETPELYSAP